MNDRQTQVLSPTGSELRSANRISQIVALRDEGLLLWEIAERMGVSKERVRQILAKASAMGAGPKEPKQVVTRRASMLLGMSPEVRPGSFQRLMAKFGITPVASKRGRLYWSVEGLLKKEPPRCVVCQSPIPMGRFARSATCSRHCSTSRRSQNSGRARTRVAGSKATDQRTRTGVAK